MKLIRHYLGRFSAKLSVILYILIAILTVLSYLQAKQLMIVQDAWIWIIKSNVTMNFIIFLFLWGVFIDKATKKMSKKKGWAIWAVSLAILIMVFKYIAGMETIF